jgi:hypothetical protein
MRNCVSQRCGGGGSGDSGSSESGSSGDSGGNGESVHKYILLPFCVQNLTPIKMWKAMLMFAKVIHQA